MISGLADHIAVGIIICVICCAVIYYFDKLVYRNLKQELMDEFEAFLDD